MRNFFYGVAHAGWLASQRYEVGEPPICVHCGAPWDEHYNAWGEIVQCHYVYDQRCAAGLAHGQRRRPWALAA